MVGHGELVVHGSGVVTRRRTSDSKKLDGVVLADPPDTAPSESMTR